MLYPCKSGWNLPPSSWDMVHTNTFWLKSGSLSHTVTLKIRSRSPKPNKHFIMSHCYIHANLVKIHPPVHKISCKQESVTWTPTPAPTGSAPKTICPPPLRWGTWLLVYCLLTGPPFWPYPIIFWGEKDARLCRASYRLSLTSLINIVSIIQEHECKILFIIWR